MDLVDIGHGTLVNFDKVRAVLNPSSAPANRLYRMARDNGDAVDCAAGRRHLSYVWLEDGIVFVSASRPETLLRRAAQGSIGRGTGRGVRSPGPPSSLPSGGDSSGEAAV